MAAGVPAQQGYAKETLKKIIFCASETEDIKCNVILLVLTKVLRGKNAHFQSFLEHNAEEQLRRHI